jgi:hemolysin activation/secretion protein
VGDGGALLVLRGLLQYSRDALVPLEQISIGGRYTVRGYRENTLVRDRGWATSAELHWPLATGSTPRRRLWLLPFVDAGSAHNQGGKSQRLASAGLGLRAQLDNIDAEIYVARRLERRPVDTRGDLQDHGIHLSVRWLAF